MNDFRPETRSLFNTLRKHKFVLVAVNNGGEWVKLSVVGYTEFLEETVAADEACLELVDETGTKCYLYLVFGNDPGELVCDHTFFEHLEVAVNEHSDRWEDRKQPKM